MDDSISIDKENITCTFDKANSIPNFSDKLEAFYICYSSAQLYIQTVKKDDEIEEFTEPIKNLIDSINSLEDHINNNQNGRGVHLRESLGSTKTYVGHAELACELLQGAHGARSLTRQWQGKLK
jgi:hypothetical protein